MAMETRIVNGRRVSLVTSWWAKHPNASVAGSPVALFCVHGVRLDRDCSTCPAPREAAA